MLGFFQFLLLGLVTGLTGNETGDWRENPAFRISSRLSVSFAGVDAERFALLRSSGNVGNIV